MDSDFGFREQYGFTFKMNMRAKNIQILGLGAAAEGARTPTPQARFFWADSGLIRHFAD